MQPYAEKGWTASHKVRLFWVLIPLMFKLWLIKPIWHFLYILHNFLYLTVSINWDCSNERKNLSPPSSQKNCSHFSCNILSRLSYWYLCSVVSKDTMSRLWTRSLQGHSQDQRCIHEFSVEGTRQKTRTFSFLKLNLLRCMIKCVSKTYYFRTVTRTK